MKHMKTIAHLAVLVAMLVGVLIGLLLASAPGFAQDDPGDAVLFADDFSRFQDWIRMNGDAIYRDSELDVLFWQTNLRPTDYYTVPLDADAGSVRLSFSVKVLQAGTSGGIFVGLAENLTGAYENRDAPTGIFAALTHTPEGTTIAYPRIAYAGQPGQGVTSPSDPASVIDLGTPGTWLGVDLAIQAGTWTLTITDAFGRQVGQIAGEMAQHSAYRHLMIFYEAREGDTLIGQLDNVAVTGQFAAPPPELCAVTADNPYVQVYVGPGLDRGQWFSLPANQPFTVTGWDVSSDGLLWWHIRVPDAESDRTWVRQDQVTAMGACDLEGLTASLAPQGVPTEDVATSDSAPSGETSITLGVGRSSACIPMEGAWTTDWLDNPELGCPVNLAAAASAQYQRFENGQAYHRVPTGEIIILFDTGIYAVYLNTWDGKAAIPCDVPNLRGAIGYLWCIDPNVQEWLGAPIFGVANLYDFIVQDFRQGMIFSADPTGTVILYPTFIWDD